MRVIAEIQIDVDVGEDAEPEEVLQAVQNEIGFTGAIVLNVEI